MKTEYQGMTITGTPDEMFTFIKLLEGFTNEMKAPDVEMRAPEKKEPDHKSPGARKTLDMGKVRALRKAGWTLDKIADEMGVSTSTIANRLKGAE